MENSPIQKLAIVITHPIQYYAPWFKLLATRQNVKLKVFYTWSQAAHTVKDKTFGRDITWDIPLLQGYDYEFITNISKQPGSHRFLGIDCPELIPKLNTFSPDAILFFGWNFKSHLKAMRHFHGKVPVWFRGDSTLLDESPRFKTLLRRIGLTWVYRHVDKAFYVGQANKAYFLKHGLKLSQLISAPHAIDNNRFADDGVHSYEEKALHWREELGYTTNDIVILYAGKLERVKQIQFLIDAFKIAVKKNESLKLLVVGNGPLEATLKVSASKTSEICFLPFQNQTKMPILYRLSNIFCLPSKSETWGLSVNEAMASSRPVIVSDKVGSTKDMLSKDVNGFVFRHDDSNALVQIMEELDLKQLSAMRVRAYETAKRFNFLNIVRALENALIGFNKK